MSKKQVVMVTTSHRGVFFGYLKKEDGDTVTLTNARMAVYWSADLRGVLGLASEGPSELCKIGPQVPEIKLFGVTSITTVSPRAAKQWEEAPWRI